MSSHATYTVISALLGLMSLDVTHVLIAISHAMGARVLVQVDVQAALKTTPHTKAHVCMVVHQICSAQEAIATIVLRNAHLATMEAHKAAFHAKQVHFCNPIPQTIVCQLAH